MVSVAVWSKQFTPVPHRLPSVRRRTNWNGPFVVGVPEMTTRPLTESTVVASPGGRAPFTTVTVGTPEPPEYGIRTAYATLTCPGGIAPTFIEMCWKTL